MFGSAQHRHKSENEVDGWNGMELSEMQWTVRRDSGNALTHKTKTQMDAHARPLQMDLVQSIFASFKVWARFKQTGQMAHSHVRLNRMDYRILLFERACSSKILNKH